MMNLVSKLVPVWIALLVGCGPSALQIQARAANEVALGANTLLPRTVEIYTQEGLAVIRAAGTREQANVGLLAVRIRWMGVWGTGQDGGPCDGGEAACRGGGWRALRATHDRWALELERQIAGHPMDLATAARLAADLRTDYCALRAAVPAGVTLPDPPSILTCGSAR